MNIRKRKLLKHMLRGMARVVLWRHHPLIVGVTGSVGKSSTKEAIALVLSRNYFVRKAEGNYNNEIGIPLTLIGVGSGGGSYFAWTFVFLRWLRVILFPMRYPDIVILEMGIDRPHDMTYLMDFLPVSIGVVTQISSSHLEFFGSISAIAKEKSRLIARLPDDGYAILNADDASVLKMQEKTRAKVMTYGFDTNALVRADNVLFHRAAKRVEGFSFKVNYAGNTIPVRLPNIVATHHIGAVLAAASVGIALKMNLVDIAAALETFEPLPGRLRLLAGKNGMMLLDDTYNASPVSTRAALDVVKSLMAPRKIVIVGDMLELGANTIEDHKALVESVITSGAQIVVTVGQYMHALYEVLLSSGFSHKQVLWFPDPMRAIVAVETLVRQEDLILVKGSQGMRMEKITEKLLIDPSEAGAFLCRQSSVWQNTPFSPPAEWDIQRK